MAQIIKRVQKYEGGKPLPILDTRIRTPFQQRIMQNGDEYKLYSDETNDFTNNPEENIEYVAPKAIIPENFLKATEKSGFKLEDINRAYEGDYEEVFERANYRYKKLNPQIVKDRVRSLIDASGKGIIRSDKGRYYGDSSLAPLNPNDKNDVAAWDIFHTLLKSTTLTNITDPSDSRTEFTQTPEEVLKNYFGGDEGYKTKYTIDGTSTWKDRSYNMREAYIKAYNDLDKTSVKDLVGKYKNFNSSDKTKKLYEYQQIITALEDNLNSDNSNWDSSDYNALRASAHGKEILDLLRGTTTQTQSPTITGNTVTGAGNGNTTGNSGTTPTEDVHKYKGYKIYLNPGETTDWSGDEEGTRDNIEFRNRGLYKVKKADGSSEWRNKEGKTITNLIHTPLDIFDMSSKAVWTSTYDPESKTTKSGWGTIDDLGKHLTTEDSNPEPWKKLFDEISDMSLDKNYKAISSEDTRYSGYKHGYDITSMFDNINSDEELIQLRKEGSPSISLFRNPDNAKDMLKYKYKFIDADGKEVEGTLKRTSEGIYNLFNDEGVKVIDRDFTLTGDLSKRGFINSFGGNSISLNDAANLKKRDAIYFEKTINATEGLANKYYDAMRESGEELKSQELDNGQEVSFLASDENFEKAKSGKPILIYFHKHDGSKPMIKFKTLKKNELKKFWGSKADKIPVNKKGGFIEKLKGGGNTTKYGEESTKQNNDDNLYEDFGSEISFEGSSSPDEMERMTLLLTDIAGFITGLIPVPGASVFGAGLGITSTIGGAVLDFSDDTIPVGDAITNLATSAGLDVLSLLPGGGAGKVVKGLRTFKKFLVPTLMGLATYGARDTAAKLVNDDYDEFTVEDWRNISNIIQSVITGGIKLNGTIKSPKASNLTLDGKTVKVANPDKVNASKLLETKNNYLNKYLELDANNVVTLKPGVNKTTVDTDLPEISMYIGKKFPGSKLEFEYSFKNKIKNRVLGSSTDESAVLPNKNSYTDAVNANAPFTKGMNPAYLENVKLNKAYNNNFVTSKQMSSDVVGFMKANNIKPNSPEHLEFKKLLKDNDTNGIEALKTKIAGIKPVAPAPVTTPVVQAPAVSTVNPSNKPWGVLKKGGFLEKFKTGGIFTGNIGELNLDALGNNATNTNFVSENNWWDYDPNKPKIQNKSAFQIFTEKEGNKKPLVYKGTDTEWNALLFNKFISENPTVDPNKPIDAKSEEYIWQGNYLDKKPIDIPTSKVGKGTVDILNLANTIFSNSRNYKKALQTQVALQDPTYLKESVVKGDIAALSAANNVPEYKLQSSDPTLHALYSLDRNKMISESQLKANLINAEKINETLKYNEGIANANLAEAIRTSNVNKAASVEKNNFDLKAYQVFNDANTTALNKYGLIQADKVGTNQLSDRALKEELYQEKIRDRLNESKVQFDKDTIEQKEGFIQEKWKTLSEETKKMFNYNIDNYRKSETAISDWETSQSYKDMLSKVGKDYKKSLDYYKQLKMESDFRIGKTSFFRRGGISRRGRVISDGEPTIRQRLDYILSTNTENTMRVLLSGRRK